MSLARTDPGRLRSGVMLPPPPNERQELRDQRRQRVGKTERGRAKVRRDYREGYEAGVAEGAAYGGGAAIVACLVIGLLAVMKGGAL